MTQNKRIERQRAEPRKIKRSMSSAQTSKTVPSDDLLEILSKVQSTRLDEQRTFLSKTSHSPEQ